MFKLLSSRAYWLFFLSCICFMSTSMAQGLVKLRGKVNNPVCDSIEVSYNDNYLAYYPKKFSAKLDAAGRFSVSFPVAQGVFTIVQLQYCNSLADLLVSEGDSLVMSVNAKKFDSSVHYAGRGANVQNFIADHTFHKGRMNQYPNEIKALIQKDPAEFTAGINAALASEEEYLRKWKIPLPPAFVDYWQAFHRYYNYFFIQQYPQTHQMLRLKRYSDTVSGENYAVVKEMPLAFADSLLQVPPYLLYLTGALEIKLKAAGYTWHGNDTMGRRLFEDSVLRFADRKMPPASLEFYTAQNIYGRARDQDLWRTESQLAAYRSRWPASRYLQLLDNQVGIARRLAPGQPAPDMEIITPDGRRMHLSDLKGKVVYLGFWAGWCKQCVGEMNSEKMIKDLIRKKPLEFVYVSIGEDTATERMLVNRFKISGLFTTAVGGWSSKEVGDYGVQALPSYYLIDEDGKFAMQRAPNPRQTTELVMAIEKLFKD